MIAFIPTISGLKEFENKISPRKMHKIRKNALIAVMTYWHKEILPKHFSPSQYSLYPHAFHRKKKSGQSMVESGEFKNRMSVLPKIRATYRKVSTVFLFGRPSNATNVINNSDIAKDIKVMSEKSKRRIFASMKGKNYTFKEAQRVIVVKMYQKNTYKAKTTAMFAEGISAMNENDINEMNNFVNTFVIKELKA